MGRFWAILLAWLLAGPGCLDIDGGAAEVAWVIRESEQQSRVPCDYGAKEDRGLPAISQIRLRIQPVLDTGELGADLCASGEVKGCTFECNRNNGTTPFDIPVPAGSGKQDYFFSLEPLSSDGSPISPAIVATPPPMLRTVREGDLTDLGLWMVVIQVPE